MKLFGYPINDVILSLGAKDNQGIKVDGEYYRFLTSMFLHLAAAAYRVNAYSLYAIGPETERMYGTARFLAIYFIAGLAGGVASFALIGRAGGWRIGRDLWPGWRAGGVLLYIARACSASVARRQLGSLITVIMINLFIGFSSGGLIDNFAHLGGLAGGALLGWLLAPRFAVDERIYPPQVVRSPLPWGWAATIGFLALLVVMVITINPPIQITVDCRL